jgi:hypothetical protein
VEGKSYRLTAMGLTLDSRILIQLYEDLLRKYPFSITGRPNPENELSNFFSRFCRHPIVKDRDNIVFIIALYAELESLKLENLTLEHVINWQTKPLKNLLLFNYEGEYPDLILSFYLTLLSHISKKRDITATNIIADSIRSDVDLRIKFTQFREPSIHFIEREDVIEFRTPHKIFRETLWDEKKGCLKTGEVRRILQKYLTKDRVESRLIATANREEPHVFEIDRNKRNAFEEVDASGNVTSPAIDEIFDPDKVKETVNSYFDEFARLSKRVLAGKLKESDSVKNLTWIAIGGAFLSAYYDINLDYVLSVCNVSGRANYTLGGLAVGSRRSLPLSSAERALFSIVSDHISANLAAQMAHDLYTKQFLKGKAPYVLQKFASQRPFKTLTHFKEDQDERTAELAQAAYSAYRRYDVRKVLSADTAEKVTGYLYKLRKPDEVEPEEYERIRRNYEQIKNAMRFSARELWEHLNTIGENYRQDGIDFILTPQDPYEGNLSNTSIYADYDWIKTVIEIALKNSCREKDKAFDPCRFDGEAEIKVKIFFLDEQKNERLTPPEKGPSVLHCVIQDSGIGCNVYEIPTRGSSYGLFFESSATDAQRYREVLNAHGNLTIESRKCKLDFLQPNEKIPSDFEEYGPENGTRVTLMLNVVSYG